MTLALGRTATVPMPTYRRGCKPGHRRLEFIEGECFACGRHDPPATQLHTSALEQLGRKRYALAYDAWAALDEAIAQTQLKLRALALLDEVDIEDAEAYGVWLIEHEDDRKTVDQRLRVHDEHEVRWAIKAAYV